MSIVPEKINPHRLARSMSRLEGHLDISALSRIVGLSDSNENQVAEICLQFGYDSSNNCYIQGKLYAEVFVECQRCMQNMQIKVDNDLSLCPMQEDDKNSTEYEEVILQENMVNIHQLVEDEILLTIPLYPKHQSIQCVESLN